jgi:hypothetical protein
VGCGCFVFCYGYSVGYPVGYSRFGYSDGFSVSYSYCDEYGYSSPDSDASPDTNADSDIRRGSMPVVPDFRLSRSGADGELVALFGRFSPGVGDAD